MEELLKNINKVHTTELGLKRLKQNLYMKNRDVLSYCKKIIQHGKISRRGKNWYCENDDVIITINASSYTIITAHLKEKK